MAETTTTTTTAGKKTVSGGCICGKVTYTAEISTESLGIVYCHCTDCQEAHTAPYVSAFLMAESNVTWTGLFDTCLGYNRRGTNIRYFCKTCGVHICCHKTPYKMFAIFPSSISKADVPLKASMHIMVAEKDPCITLPDDGIPHLDGFPS